MSTSVMHPIRELAVRHAGHVVTPDWKGAVWRRGVLVGYRDHSTPHAVVVQVEANALPAAKAADRTLTYALNHGAKFVWNQNPQACFLFLRPHDLLLADGVPLAPKRRISAPGTVKPPEFITMTVTVTDDRPKPCPRCYTGSKEFLHADSCGRLVKA